MKRVTCLLFAAALAPLPALADTGPDHQVRSMHFGVSGGNVNDYARGGPAGSFCCSGTLGSLLVAGGKSYVLSTNRVLGRRGFAAIGEDISQPGLVDNGCQAATVVADFMEAAPLESNVDAAIAELRAGTMDATGFIEDIGTISSVVREPMVGLAVQKSGRETGLTTGNLDAVAATLEIGYRTRCHGGRPFKVTFTNQVVVSSAGFSAGGDSGSLIVTNGACAQPVALLVAGSSAGTVGNPIGQVLNHLSVALDQTLRFVGGTCTAARDPAPLRGLERALAANERHAARLVADPAVLGVGVGASEAGSEPRAALVVFVDSTATRSPALPAEIDGVPLRVVPTDPFVADGWLEQNVPECS
jgi:hypothetical protein